MGSTGQVFADSCLVCSQQCFIRSHSLNKENNLQRRGGHFPSSSIELRQTLYKAFDVGFNAEDVVKGSVHDLPLCGSCVFKVGQLKCIQNQLTHLEQQYKKLKEEIAFSIVDIVANNLGNEVGSNIRNQPPNVILRKLKEYEVGTIQQLIFERWHEPPYINLDVQLKMGAEIKNSSQQNGTETINRQSLISTNSVMTKNNGIRERQSSISITKVETAKPKLENGGIRIYNIEDEDSGEACGEDQENSSERAFPQPDEIDYFIDEEGDAEEVQDSLCLGYPFSLEIAEYSSSIQNGNGGGGIAYGDEGEDDAVEFGFEEAVFTGEKGSTSDSQIQQNLEVFRDKNGLYECEFCQKKFIHKYPFRDHLRVHFGDGPRCKICNKIFPKKHNLMLHLRTHSGEKPYVCSVCNKGFADKSNLKVHMRVHTGERPYKCDFCNVAFSNSSRLVVHKRTHTGEKPFTCDICSRRCTTRNQLSTHRKTHFSSTGRNKIIPKK